MLYYSKNFHVSAIYALMGGSGTPVPLSDLGADELSLRRAVIVESLKQLEPKLHRVTSTVERPDKRVYKPNGEKDPITGADKLSVDFEAPSRAPLSIQKYIIGQKASFARGNGVKLRPSDEKSNIFKWVYRNWYANKTDYYLKSLMEAMLGETQVAVVFYMDTEEAKKASNRDKARLRFKILSPKRGDTMVLYTDPETGRMTGLLREYKDDKGETNYDLYLEANPEVENSKPVLRKFKEEGSYEETTLPFPKLPLVYWGQDMPECDDSAEIIDALEFALNDFLTQMGYSADPILFGKGKTLNLPAKGSAGKFIEGSEDSDLKFVTPENATESRDLQFKLLQKFIFSLNRAVILDLDTMKELGDVSGAALEKYLIDAYMQATDHQTGYWGLGVQRMVNFMVVAAKDLYGVYDSDETTVDVEFTKFKINDLKETVEIYTMANGNKPLLDQRSSISAAGLADDPAEAYERIQKEAEEASARAMSSGGQNPSAAQAQRKAALNGNGDPILTKKNKQNIKN